MFQSGPDNMKFPFDLAYLTILMPMHVVLDAQDRIVSKGKTLAKLVGKAECLADAFMLCSLDGSAEQRSLLAKDLPSDCRFTVRLKENQELVLCGVCVPLHGDLSVMNFGFGACLPEAVRKFGLTMTDFSPVDMATEFLFLHEANRAAMELLSSTNASLERATIDAQRQSLTDPLTGLWNRRSFDIEFRKAFRNRNYQSFALLHLDLDNFKEINDSFGHAVGDALLCSVSRIVSRNIRRHDLAFRIGGDEFLILAFFPKQSEGAGPLACRLIEQIERLNSRFSSASLSASIGVALSWRKYTGCMQMSSCADKALYMAKAEGKGRAVISSE